MSADILVVEQTELLIEEGDDVLIEVDTVVELLEVAEQGPSGPRGLQGLQGIQGIQGNPGPGVPAGGTAGQIVAKRSNADYDYELIDPPNGATNLSYTASPTGGTVASDTGNDAAIPLADGTNAGLMAPAEHTKLAGVAANATANATDAQLRDRATHTGVQAATTITEDSTHRFATDAEKTAWNAKQDALGYTPENSAHKGAANGYASLDSGGQIPAAQIPSIAIVQYLGSVASQVAMLALVGQSGDWCVRSDSGTVWVITGSSPTLLSSWTQFTYPASPVRSVAGRAGDVTLTATDITDSTTVGRAVMTAANAAAARSALALGTAATSAIGDFDAAGAAAAALVTAEAYTDTGIATRVPTSRTVNGHALSADVTVTASDVGLGSVTNDAQTKATIVPNAAPSAGDILVGNAGGTAYAKQAVGGDATLAVTGALTLATVNGNTGTLGDASHTLQITVDGKGRITGVTSLALPPFFTAFV